MTKWKGIYLIIGSVLAVGIYCTSAKSVSAEEAKEKSGIVAGEFRGEATITMKEEGKAAVHYTVKNQTPNKLELEFSNGLKADYILYDSRGMKVTQYSDDVLVTQAIEYVPLKQGETYSQAFILNDLPSGTYTLKLFLNVPKHNGAVTKTFTIPAQTFKDIQANHWAKAEIDYLIAQDGLMGYSDGTFRPNVTVTYEQAALILARLLEMNEHTAIEQLREKSNKKLLSLYERVTVFVFVGAKRALYAFR